MCETETSGTEVLDDVPNCEIEQTEVCQEDATLGTTVCRTVPRQKCGVTQQGQYSVWSGVFTTGLSRHWMLQTLSLLFRVTHQVDS